MYPHPLYFIKKSATLGIPHPLDSKSVCFNVTAILLSAGSNPQSGTDIMMNDFDSFS